MLKQLLVYSLFLISILIMIFSYLYVLMLNKEEVTKRKIKNLDNDNILYNLKYLKKKLLFANLLGDDSLLCENDNDMVKENMFKNNFDLLNGIEYDKKDKHYKHIKEEEQKLIQKILKIN